MCAVKNLTVFPLDSTNLRKIKRKNKLWSKVRKKLASEEEKLQLKKLKNQVRRLTRKAQKIVEKQIAKDVKKNPKKFWGYSQRKLKTRPGIPDLKRDASDGNISGNNYTQNDCEKAQEFLSYFSSVFTIENTEGGVPYFPKQEYQKELTNIMITREKVLKKLKAIKTNKSPGPDRMHPRVLHEIADSIVDPITHIYCTSLKTMTLPAEWRHAIVTAIYKKGPKTLASNYRPVSLTPILCKVMESFIRDATHEHMIANNLYSDKQFGFINARSTTLQMLHVLDIWSRILDEGGTIDAIYCDFMKAFDKVPHERLLHKIHQYGITGNVLGWIKSFLTNRTQQVCIKNTLSDKAPVTSGIPQGSVLGPLLFVIYINDLPNVVDGETFVYLFADDTKVFRDIKSVQDSVILQNDINQLKKWSDKWLLKFHPQKCVSMTICNKSEPGLAEKTKRSYNMDGHKLNISDCEKDIGIHVDEHLSFDVHINYIVNKANRILAIIRKSFEYMDLPTFSYLYKGLVRPQLEYATPVWSPHLMRQIEAIENVQIRATKMVPGLSNLTYPERLRKLDIPTLSYRRLRGDMITMFKLNCKPITGAYDSSLPTLFAHFPKELRGHNKKLVYDQHRLDIRKFNFTVRNVEPWNSLPQHVIDSETIIEFERNLDKHWKKQEIYYDNYKAKIHTKTKWIYINLSKAPLGCKSGNRKRVSTGRRYSWGISPLHEPVLTISHPLHVPQQSSTAGVSPPYSQYRVQLGYLPLTLTNDKGTAGVFPPYPPRYSRGISPLPIHISNCWVTAGDAKKKKKKISQQGHQWQLLHRSMPQYLRSLWYYNIPYHWECLRLFTYLLLNWVNILLCISCLIYCWSKGHLCTF